jgi:hypothetical protein
LSGPLPPWVISRVCEVLSGVCTDGAGDYGVDVVNRNDSTAGGQGCCGSSDGGFTVDLTTPQHCLALNVWSSSRSAGGAGDMQPAGQQDQLLPAGAAAWQLLVPGEVHAWCDGAPAVRQRVVHHITALCKRGRGRSGSEPGDGPNPPALADATACYPPRYVLRLSGS